MATTTTYDVGDLARITGTFTTIVGVPQDPASLQFVLETPSGATTTYTFGVDAALLRDAQGVYHFDINLTEAGVWRYRWVSTGTGQAAEPGQLTALGDPLSDATSARQRDALDRLRRMTAYTEEPALSDDELNDLLDQNKRADVNGLYVSDAGWIPTYDLNAAAAEGWLWKAGKVSPNYSFGIDASRDMQSDVFTHCMAMHEQYTKGSSGSAKVESMIDDFDPATGYGGPLVTGFFDGPFT